MATSVTTLSDIFKEVYGKSITDSLLYGSSAIFNEEYMKEFMIIKQFKEDLAQVLSDDKEDICS